MSEEEKLKAGMVAIRSGERGRAASIFAEIVKSNPLSEQGWYLLGISCTAPDQREYCFRRVITLNPNNQEATNQLVSLSKLIIAQPPAWASQPPAIQNTSTPATTTISPFVYEENIPSPVGNKESVKFLEDTYPKVEQQKKAVVQPKKSNKVLIFSLLSIPILIGFGFAIAYLLYPKQSFTNLPATQIPLPLLPASSPTPLPPTAIPTAMPTVEYTAIYEKAPCPFDTPVFSDTDCGYLIVPEDRTGDPTHTIRLAVAVYHSTSENPEHPVMFLQGGPGAGAVQLSADAYDFLVAPFLSERDFIVFDQRGTGLSEPFLHCDELKKIYSQDIHGLIPSTTRELVYSNAFLSCNGLMKAQGVKLNAYTTVESAADVRDILKVLGYEKVNLYGASYGTRLAQVVMRDHAQIVQSAILDSVVPIETNLFNKYADSSESALKTLFDTCAADLECNTAYPDLETVFWDLVTKLDARPVTVTTSTYPIGTVTESVTGSTFRSIILGSIKSSYFLSTAPQTIHRFELGDYSTLIAAQYGLPFAFEDISPGLYISMMCHEHILTTTPEELQNISTRRGVKDYGWLPFQGNADNIFETCKSWGSVSPYLGENDPVISDIPSLIITGKYDPVTPPVYGQQIAERLSNSYYFEFSNLGHTPTAADGTGCAMDIAIAFLADPTVEPDRSCLDNLEKEEFLVPYTGNPPLSLDKTTIMGVSVDAPEDWYNIGDGFFFRGSSSLDITQIGVLRAILSAEELKDWFSLSIYGYRGLDTAPVKASQLEVNNLTWTLYTSTSNGRPVDIAMADYKGNSLVILMFSHIDEREALYQTIFLPMVESAK
ncbi:MAG: alpha/beta hydrolase [Anaerolineales bacterium]|nr:alpha/beta hydrolase [Anaerolineales bacterium]